MTKVLTIAELDTLEAEIQTINKESDWRDPNLEASWFDWAERRTAEIIQVLEASLYQARRRKLRVIGRG